MCVCVSQANLGGVEKREVTEGMCICVIGWVGGEEGGEGGREGGREDQ